MGITKIFYIKRLNIFSILGGTIFLVIFLIGYSNIEDNLYQYRDDGLITMSNGKNLVDYGFVGINPSGPRVESSSSPLQTLLFATVNYLFNVDYKLYANLQTMIATFIIGFVFIRFFSDKLLRGTAITIICAIGLTFAYPFFLWHGSGMENALIHALFLFTVYILYQFYQSSKINNWMVLIVFFATIVRIDSIYHIFPVLLTFSIYWYLEKKDLKGFNFLFKVLLIWIVFQTIRFLYFGDILPNTAYAQNISLIGRIKSLASVNTLLIKNSLLLSSEIFLKQYGWLIGIAVPFAIIMKKDKKILFLSLICLSMIVTCLLNPFIFGPTRIDQSRTTTQMTLIIFLLISMIYYSITSSKKTALIFSCILPITISLYVYLDFKPYYLGWSTKSFNKVRRKFLNIAKKHNIYRPTVSNPDLGIMSYNKNFNIVDLGKLGSPIMSKITKDSVLQKYYLEYILPDIVEAHGFWLNKYKHLIFSTNRFKKLYKVIKRDPARIYWIRKAICKNSKSVERELLNDLQNQLSVDRISKEINKCRNNGNSYSYVSRTVYKFIPELRIQKKFNKVFDLFSNKLDKAFLEGWRNPESSQIIINELNRN